MQVAKTILAQLGNNRFVAMTGAKNLVGGENSLSFSLPRGAKNGINKVKITLDPSDTYTVEFFKYRNFDLKLISESDNVYCDMLQEIFTNHTGLYTKL